MIGGFIAISIFFAVSGKTGVFRPLIWQDWLWLLILGIVCTAFAFWAMLRVLQKVSAYTVVLAINMEPVYGFVMAAVIFGENQVLGAGFYIGSFVILASIFLYSWRKRKEAKTLPES
jgi:drug/metabolite transporter (DMT)-like permease